MEDEKVLAISQICKEFNIAPSDLICFLRTLCKISEEEAQKAIWMVAGTDVKESN